MPASRRRAGTAGASGAAAWSRPEYQGWGERGGIAAFLAQRKRSLLSGRMTRFAGNRRDLRPSTHLKKPVFLKTNGLLIGCRD